MTRVTAQVTIMAVAVVIVVRVLACALPRLTPYIAALFVMAIIGRVIWHHTRL